MIKPNVSIKASEHIKVGTCDHGPLQYNITTPGKDGNTYVSTLRHQLVSYMYDQRKQIPEYLLNIFV